VDIAYLSEVDMTKKTKTGGALLQGDGRDFYAIVRKELAHTRIEEIMCHVESVQTFLQGDLSYDPKEARADIGFVFEWLDQLSDRMPNLTPSGEPQVVECT
jgi:hypothetical protein